MQFLATTNGSLEEIAITELEELCGVDAEIHHRGVVQFEADREAAYDLHYRGRSIHRLMRVLVDASVDELEDIYDRTRRIDAAARLPDATFGVSSTRHGSHDFTSVDVSERVGQAIIDGYREAAGRRLPVDLDDPTVALEAYVYDDRFTLAVDLTGESLHKRPYRVCEHDAPLRSTLGYALLRLSGYESGDRLLDPTCGSATIPIEAALTARDRIPRPDLQPALEALPEFDAAAFRERRATHEPLPLDVDVEGRDRREEWLRCGRVNCEAAGLEDAVTIRKADAREATIDADRVVANLPFGVRVSEDLRDLYAGVVDRLREGTWKAFVGLTTRPDLLPIEPTETRQIPYGRLDATVVIVER